MDVKVIEAGPCRKVLQVNAPAEAIAGEYAQAVKAFAEVARLPGFRKGKAPLNIVERHYSRQIAEETKERLVPQLYRKALEEQKLTPVAVVEVKDVVFEKAQGLNFNVTIDVAPEFKLPKYKRISIREETASVTDAQVDESIQRLRERLARFQAASGRQAQAGDLVRVDYCATLDGQPLAAVLPSEKAIGEAKDFLVYLGDPEFLPGFTAALTGALAGESRSVNVTFPAEFPAKDLVGREAAYTVTVKEVQERILPAMDAEFLKRFEVETEAGLREKINGELLENARRTLEAKQREDIVRFLLEKTEFEVPQSIVEQETRLAVRGMVQEIARRGATREQIVEQQESIVNEANRTSSERVRISYILGRIADEEKILVEDAEVEERMAALAARYGMPVERFREEFEKRSGVDGLRSDIRAEKTLSFLLQESKAK